MKPLPRLWVSAGSSGLWPGGGTYTIVPYDALPPLPWVCEGDFAWLHGAPPPRDPAVFEHQPLDGVSATLDALSTEAAALGLTLPAPFARFLLDPSLHARVPTCTACYWDLGARLVPVPDHEGPERLLRFFNDQQTCVLWYLLLEPGERHSVAAAAPDWRDEADGTSLEDFITPRDVSVCADEFEAFVQRFYVENAVWYAHHGYAQWTGALDAYAEAARRTVADGRARFER